MKRLRAKIIADGDFILFRSNTGSLGLIRKADYHTTAKTVNTTFLESWEIAV